MAEAYYEPTPATDGATMNPVPGAVFQVYEIADTTFSTPLSLRVGSGNPTTTVTASESLATLPGVYVTSPNYEHIWKSGTFQWRRDSIDGAKKAIEDAKIAASNSASSADASAQSAASSAALAQAPTDAQVDQGIQRADIPGTVEAKLAAAPTVVNAAAQAAADYLGGVESTTRINEADNPALSVNADGWVHWHGSGGAGSSGRVAATSGYAYRLTWTTGTTSVNGDIGYGRSNADDIGVTAGQTITASAEAKASIQQRLRAQVQFYNSSGGNVGSITYGPSSLVPATTAQRFTVTATAPTGAVRASVRISAVQGGSNDAVNWPVGAWFEVTRMLIEVGSTAGTYFDGDTAGATWSGTPGASTSSLVVFDLLSTPDLAAESSVRAAADGDRIKPTFATLPAAGSALSRNDLTYHLGHDLQVITTGYTTSGDPIADLKAAKIRRLGNRAENMVTPTRPITAYGAAAWARINQPVSVIPPAIEFLGTDVALSTALGTGAVNYPATTPAPIKFRGLHQTTATVDGETVVRNVFNGSGPRQPWSAEFVLDVTGWDEAIAVRYVGTTTDPVPSIQVFIDGQPAGTRLSYDPAPSATAERLVRIGGLTPGAHSVQVRFYNLDLVSIATSDGVTVRAQPRDLPTAAMMWNSWGELSTAWAWWQDGILPRLADMLEVEPYYGVQGGWGVSHPAASGGKTPIADASRNRLTPVTAVAPDWLFLMVGQQDEGNTTGFQAALEDVLGYLGTNAPNTHVLLRGVERQNGNGNGNKATLDTITKNVAAAYPNVAGGEPYALPYTDEWVSGSTATLGWGSADLEMHRGDTAHPSIFGTAMWAVREYESVVQHLRVKNIIDGRGFTMDKSLLNLP